MMTGLPAAIAPEPTLPPVTDARGWLAAVWAPDGDAVAGLPDGVEVRAALGDQGRFTGGDHFARLATGPGDPPADVDGLGARVWAWRTRLNVVRAAPAPLAVTMVAFPRRRAGSTHEVFARHWTERHAPLALRHHAGLADYRQHVVVEPLTDEGADVDGIALLGFRDHEDLATRFYDSEAGKAAIRGDVARFIAPPVAGAAVATTLVGPPEPGRADR